MSIVFIFLSSIVLVIFRYVCATQTLTLNSSYPFPPGFDNNVTNAGPMTLSKEQVIIENGTVNTAPANVTLKRAPKLIIQSAITAPQGVLSGDWVTIQAVQSKSYLSSPAQADCFRVKQDLCDAKLTGKADSADGTEKFQIFIQEWDQVNSKGRVAFKDYLGRWITTGNSVLFVSQKDPVVSFDEAVSSAFQSFYLVQTGGTNGYFQIYRNFTIDEHGQSEAVYFDGSSWTLAPTSMAGDPVLDIALVFTNSPASSRVYGETLLNTRFDIPTLENHEESWQAIAQTSLCNLGPINQSVVLQYSFTPSQIYMASSGFNWNIDTTIRFAVGSPEIENAVSWQWQITGGVSGGVSFTHGKVAGWWNMTANGQQTWVYVPPQSYQDVRVIAKYEYDKSLKWTATYQRTFADGTIFTYDIDGTWNRVSYWDSRVEYGNTLPATNCTNNIIEDLDTSPTSGGPTSGGLNLNASSHTTPLPFKSTPIAIAVS